MQVSNHTNHPLTGSHSVHLNLLGYRELTFSSDIVLTVQWAWYQQCINLPNFLFRKLTYIGTYLKVIYHVNATIT